MPRVLLTGSTGFVGSVLYSSLLENYEVVSVFRNQIKNLSKNCFSVGDFNESTNFSDALNDIDTVIHLAARAHIANECTSNSLDEYRKCNTKATLKLAKQSAEAGVRRFIFISSIGVNGVSNEQPFTAFDTPKLTDNYAISKYEAEIGLKEISETTGMEFVIIRPPLVYGYAAPGNLGTLLRVAEKNFSLPLGAINNQRSFVSIHNLIDLITTCITHPNAANQVFLVSDDENISTSNFLKKLTLAAGNKPRLLPVPVLILKILASMIGKKAVVERFSSSLTIDIEHTKSTLNWRPPISLEQGIFRCFK